MRINLNSAISHSIANSIGLVRELNQHKTNKQNQYIMQSCYKLSNLLKVPSGVLMNATKDSDMKRFSFLKSMANKTVSQHSQNIEDNSEHILNIYSMIRKPTQYHFDIVSRTKDSFDSVEKIFTLAKDEKSLEFVQTLQYDVLKDNTNASKVIIELLSSKNREKYINKLGSYTSYLKLHAEEEAAIAKLDELVETGKYSRLRSDAEYAVKRLMGKKAIGVAMAGKTTTLEQAYTKERGSFLSDIVNYFIPKRTTPSEVMKNVVVDMYKSVDSENLKLRTAIMDRFKYSRVKDKNAELKEMQILFDKIDSDEEAKKFVQKAINKDLKVKTIGELNEVLNSTPLKKANIFFNNARRIIELSEGEERNAALVYELENPFFIPQKRARIVGIYTHSYENNSILMNVAKMIENKFNQFRYYHMAA